LSNKSALFQKNEEQSGQIINKDKSSAMFSKGTRGVRKRAVLHAFGILRESHNQRYLGLLVHLGASKKKEFKYLKERVWRRIQSWMEKLLSKAGKEIFIKSIPQVILRYAMLCFDFFLKWGSPSLCIQKMHMAFI
jgi:hypothetical protein